MDFDAVILAGGRSSRLGGVPKARLKYDGDSLLAHALAVAYGTGSAHAARTVVVVGPDPGTLPEGTLTAREEPAFAGPAAAIEAGLAALDAEARLKDIRHGRPLPRPQWVLVLACDMPHAGAAVQVLFAAFEEGAGSTGGVADAPHGITGEAGREIEGVMAVSADGRKQPLLGVYNSAALRREVAAAAEAGGLANASVFGLVARLDLLAVPVPPGSTDDVDTWEDAAALGVDGDLP
ncbi:molybdenum cofactor guanylyltransferase [bacterium RCC_150]